MSQLNNSHEVDVLRHLQRSSDPNLKVGPLNLLLDDFEMTSANGTHSCLVLRPLGMSMFEVNNVRRGVPHEVSWSIAKQAIEQVAFIHESGIVHGGE